MRNLIYYIACSVDGFIAHKDGSHDGFSQDEAYLTELFSEFPETVPSHLRDVMGVHADNQHFDTVLMGRKTYEIGQREGVTSPYSHLKQYLFSRSLENSPDEQVNLISHDIVERIIAMKNEGGKDIWLCGGGILATELFKHDLIDQIILKVNPFLMGAGIPLFSEEIPQKALDLFARKSYKNGVLLLQYRVV